MPESVRLWPDPFESSRYKWIKLKLNCKISLLITCCLSSWEKGKSVETWNIISCSSWVVCTLSTPVIFPLTSRPPGKQYFRISVVTRWWSDFTTSEFGPVFQLNSVAEEEQELIKPFASWKQIFWVLTKTSKASRNRKKCWKIPTRLIWEELIIHDLTCLGQDDTNLEVHRAFLLLQPKYVLLNIWIHDFPWNFLYFIDVTEIW